MTTLSRVQGEGFSVTVDNDKCSPIILKKATNAVQQIFKSAALGDVNGKYTINITDQNVTLDQFDSDGSDYKQITIQFPKINQSQKNVSLIITCDDKTSTTKMQTTTVKKKVSDVWKNAFNLLSQNLKDLNSIPNSSGSFGSPQAETPRVDENAAHSIVEISQASATQVSDQTEKSQSCAQKVKTYIKDHALILSDKIGIARNAVHFAQMLSILGILGVFLSNNKEAIFRVISWLRIFQGILSLAVGGFGLYDNYMKYQHAKEIGDIEGMEIYKGKMWGNAITIVEGILWIALGSFFLFAPVADLLAFSLSGNGDASTVFVLLTWALFYGGFVIDSSLSWMNSNKMMKNMQKHYDRFKLGILENKSLNDTQKETAAKKYLENLKNGNDVDCETAERLGFTKEKIDQILDGKLLNPAGEPLSALEAIQKVYETELAKQKAGKFLAICCLCINFSGLPMDLGLLGQLFSWIFAQVSYIKQIVPTSLQDGLQGISGAFDKLSKTFNDLLTTDSNQNADGDRNLNILFAINDALWVLINWMYLKDDASSDKEPSPLAAALYNGYSKQKNVAPAVEERFYVA